MDEDLVEKVSRTKKELIRVLKSADLEIVGVTKRKAENPLQGCNRMIENVNNEFYKEIKKVVDYDSDSVPKLRR